jgi:hypothetical protein
MRTPRTLRRVVAIAAALVVTSTVLVGAGPDAGAQTEPDCRAAGGYHINYLNGVSNTYAQAFASRRTLSEAYGSDYGGEPITYANLYNDTHGQVGDVAEVFQQKVREAVETGILTQAQISTLLTRLTGFSIRVGTTGPRTLGWILSKVPIERVRAAAEGLNRFLDSLPGWYEDAQTAVNNWMSAEVRRFADLTLLDAETRAIVDAHTTTVRGQIASGRKPLIVSHSQGNLFANPVAQNVRAVAGSSSVGVVHVATPALLTSGPWVTINTDLVIAPFFSTGAAPPANVVMTPLLAGSNHGFGDAYLRPGEQARTAVLGSISSVADDVVLPGGTGGDGLFAVTLTWDGPGDVDLHVYEPDGQHVYYGATLGGLGYLDVDNTSGYGPEHYYASCSTAAVGGSFLVGVANYSGATGRVATLQLSSASFIGDPLSVTLGSPTGSAPGYYLFRVGVTQTADGRLEVQQLPV